MKKFTEMIMAQISTDANHETRKETDESEFVVNVNPCFQQVAVGFCPSQRERRTEDVFTFPYLHICWNLRMNLAKL